MGGGIGMSYDRDVMESLIYSLKRASDLKYDIRKFNDNASKLDCDIKELNENLKALISLLSSCEKGTGKVRVLSLNKEDKQ